MRLTECQSKAVLAEFGVPLTRAHLAHSVEDAVQAARAIDGPVVLKAQVPFGGRGKSGAVRFADAPEAAGTEAQALLGMTLRDVVVNQISVEPRITFGRELYVGVAWDTVAKLPVALLSTTGGVDVESNAEAVIRRCFDPGTGLPAYAGRELAGEAGLTGKLMVGVGAVLSTLAEAFLELDASTLEINPLVETTDGELIGLDVHLEVDDDAAYRQARRLERLGDIAESSAARAPTAIEQRAKEIDAMDHRGVAGRVVEFDGSLGLLIGGGGASLTVFDAVLRYGGRPANYCEVGGNPTEQKVAALTELLLSKPGVNQVAVIMNVVNNTRADVMAHGVIEGVLRAGLTPADVVSVFRIPGSWEQEAVALLEEHGITALSREVSLDEAARIAVEKAKSHVDRS